MFLSEIFIGYCSCYEATCKVMPKNRTLSSSVNAFIEEMRNNPSVQCNMIVRKNDVESLLELFSNTGLIRRDRDFTWKFASNDEIRWTVLKAGDRINVHTSDNPLQKCFCYPLQTGFSDSVKKYLNISLSQDDVHQLAHILFWYLRKGVVDMLLKTVTKDTDGKTSQCTALSVGSTNITSDYDVTINASCASLIKEFNDKFKTYFGVSSMTAFDTNLYGSSVILNVAPNDNQKSLYSKITCGNSPVYQKQFWVLHPSSNYRYSLQHNYKEYIVRQYEWALLKLARGIIFKLTHDYELKKQRKSDTNRFDDKYKNIIENPEWLLKILELCKKSALVDKHSDIVHNYPTIQLYYSTAKSGGAGSLPTSKFNSLSEANILRQLHPIGSDNIPSTGKTLVVEVNKMRSRAKSEYKGSSPHNISNPKLSNVEKEREIDNHNNAYTALSFNTLLEYTNFEDLVHELSRINSRGSETYYTRAAIIDVVINQQSCSNSVAIQLDADEYIQSILEQFSDFIFHDFNDKYRKRMSSAVMNLSKLFGEDALLKEYAKEFSPVRVDSVSLQPIKDSQNKEIVNPMVPERTIQKMAIFVYCVVKEVTTALQTSWDERSPSP